MSYLLITRNQKCYSSQPQDFINLMMKTQIYFWLLFPFFIGNGSLGLAQAAWTYKGEENGIKGYTRIVGNGIEMRYVTQSSASPSAFIGVLKDVKKHHLWMTGIKSSTLLKEQNLPLEIYYYSIVPFPWPMDNRDAVMHGTVLQNAQTKKVSVTLRPIPSYFPAQKKHIRLKTFEMDVTLNPQKSGKTSFEAIMRIGEADGMPIWLIDWLVSEKFFSVIHNLCKMAEKEPYKNFKHPAIQ